MTAIITVSLDHIHPVIDGRWHLIPRLLALPQPGETITTLCGIAEPVVYQAKREQVMPAHACADCQEEFWKRQGAQPYWQQS
jgi:hypothetical protein